MSSSLDYLARIQERTTAKGSVDLWPASHDVAGALASLERVIDRKAQVLVWASNNRFPMADLLGAWLFLGVITEEQAMHTDKARSHDEAEFIAALRGSQPAEPSAEERFEARAAFGPGETVVDVVTGRRFTT